MLWLITRHIFIDLNLISIDKTCTCINFDVTWLSHRLPLITNEFKSVQVLIEGDPTDLFNFSEHYFARELSEGFHKYCPLLGWL